jgi:hypothetical protein
MGEVCPEGCAVDANSAVFRCGWTILRCEGAVLTGNCGGFGGNEVKMRGKSRYAGSDSRFRAAPSARRRGGGCPKYRIPAAPQTPHLCQAHARQPVRRVRANKTETVPPECAGTGAADGGGGTRYRRDGMLWRRVNGTEDGPPPDIGTRPRAAERANNPRIPPGSPCCTAPPTMYAV